MMKPAVMHEQGIFKRYSGCTEIVQISKPDVGSARFRSAARWCFWCGTTLRVTMTIWDPFEREACFW